MIITNGLLLTGILFVLFFSKSYFYFFFVGPTPLTDDELLRLAQQPPSGSLLAYADLGERELIDTRWKEVTTQDDKPLYDSHYYFVPVQDQVLLVLAKSEQEAARLTGPLSRMRKFDEDIVERVLAEQPQFKGRVLPFILNDAAAFNVIGYIGLAVMGPFAALGFANIAQALFRMSHPLSHPSVRKLTRFGDPEAIVKQVDAAIETGDYDQVGRALLVGDWLIRPTVFGVKMFPLAELVWLFQHTVQRESFVVLHFRDGRKSDISLKPEQAEEVIQRISERYPWARRGYKKEWQQAWATNCAQFIATVEKSRRAEEDA